MTAPTLTGEDVRRDELKALARTWDRTGSEERMDRLCGLVHPSLRGLALDEAWETFVTELALLDGVNGEPWAEERDWRDVNDELVGPDRTEVARDEMYMRVGGALDVLIRGKR